MEFLSLLLLWCLCVPGAPGAIEGHLYGYVVYDGDIDQEDAFTTDSQEAIPMYAVARATYHNVINSTGWAYLELATSDSYSDDRQAFGAGYLEGFVTHRLIWLSYRNTLDGWLNLNGDLEDLATALGVEEQHGGKKQPRSRKAEGDGRCSALIKLLGDYSDILWKRRLLPKRVWESLFKTDQSSLIMRRRIK